MKYFLIVIMLTIPIILLGQEFKSLSAKAALNKYKAELKKAEDIKTAAEAQYKKDLEAALASAMKAGNLDEANLIKAELEPDGGVEAPKEKALSGTKKSSATIHAVCDDTFEIYINGERILAGGMNAVKADVQIGIGDVIAVKVINTGGAYGFGCVIKFDSGSSYIATNVKHWKSFKPINQTKWFLPSSISFRDAKNSTFATNQDNKNTVTVNSGIDCEGIWGDDSISYLFLKVTKDNITTSK